MTGSAIRRGGWIGLVLVVALAAAAAAYAGTGAKTAGETLVIDRSFEIKTSDPQRAFEPTASLVEPGDLRHAVHVPRLRRGASDPAARPVVAGHGGREDVHVPAQAERALRRRHAAHRRPTSCSRSVGS